MQLQLDPLFTRLPLFVQAQAFKEGITKNLNHLFAKQIEARKKGLNADRRAKRLYLFSNFYLASNISVFILRTINDGFSTMRPLRLHRPPKNVKKWPSKQNIALFSSSIMTVAPLK